MEFQVSFNFPKGTKPQEIASELRFHAGLLEGLAPKTASSKKNTESSFEETNEDPKEEPAPQEEFDFSAENSEASETEVVDDFMEAPKKTKTATKVKKITLAEVNDACKAKAKAGGKDGRKQVLSLLQKHFKTESISEIKPENYGKLIEIMKVSQ